MNVTFHTAGALATAAFLSSAQVRASSGGTAPRQSPLMPVIGFAAGVVEHGVMDYIPHSYPIPSGMDIVFSLFLLIAALTQTRAQFRVLVIACFTGSVLPDLVDLGPAILNHRVDWTLPTMKIFPWHWPQYSGSLYRGVKKFQSAVSHSVIIAVCVSLLWFYRHSLFSSTSKGR